MSQAKRTDCLVTCRMLLTNYMWPIIIVLNWSKMNFVIFYNISFILFVVDLDAGRIFKLRNDINRYK